MTKYRKMSFDGYIPKTIKIGDQTISGWSTIINSNNDYIYSSFEVFIFYNKDGILQKVNHGKETYMNNWHKNRGNFSLSREWFFGKLNSISVYETDFVRYEGNFSVFVTSDGRNISFTGSWKGKQYTIQEHSDRVLVYDGDFYDNKYDGIGTTFYVCPRRIYKYCNDDNYDPELDTRTKMYVGSWKDGKMYGPGSFYHSNGQIQHEGYNWKNDGMYSGLGKSYTKNGTIQFEGEYKDGKKHGPWKTYYLDSTLESEGYYNDGMKHGLWHFYYENGTLEFKGEFNNDKKEGKGTSYYQSSSIIYDGLWKDNIMCDFGYFYDIHDMRSTLLLTQKGEDDSNTSIV